MLAITLAASAITPIALYAITLPLSLFADAAR
jgi:hypothetical protein